MSKKIPFVTKEQLEKIVSQYPTQLHHLSYFFL